MMQRSPSKMDELIDTNPEKLDKRYYQDEGDPLAAFRRIIPGGVPMVNDKDPFENDPDWKQYLSQQKLDDSQRMRN